MHCEEAERAVKADVNGRDPVPVWKWCAGEFHVERGDGACFEAFGEESGQDVLCTLRDVQRNRAQ